ncbi:putative transporter [bacterium HR33]|nr:putative transporter [bacterium HR33]
MTGIAIFAVTYLLIAVQRLPLVHLNRPAASLLGAVAMVGFGVITVEEAYAAVDMDVLVFLLGLMLIVGYLEVGRFFEWAAAKVLERIRSPLQLLFAVVVGGGLMSAFFVNDTVCLVMTPVLLLTLRRLGERPQPYLIALAMGSNVGSVLSITGNPQNMLIGIWSGASFSGFLLDMLPVAAGGLAVTFLCLRWAYRAVLRDRFEQPPHPETVVMDRSLVYRALALFAVAVVGWMAGGSLPVVAITCGAVMVAVAQRDPAYAIERVDWDLLLMFAALFVVMRGLESTGATDWMNRKALALAGGGSPAEVGIAASAAMLLLSNLISNVPAVMLWRNVVPALPEPDLMWRFIAMSSTFAGNFLLIGSVANLIVAERAEAYGVRLSFGEYARVGVPVTLLTMAWGIAVLLLK